MIERLFYYTSEQIIVGQKMDRATGEQWIGILNGKISKEEDKLLGLEEYFKRNVRNVLSKADIIAQIDKNRLHLEEHVLEGKGINTLRLQYATPNLSNYKEIVISSPDIARYETDNIHFTDVAGGRDICWCRCADVTEDNRKILLIDEMQSSRHQDAKTYGYDSALQPNYFSSDVAMTLLDSAVDAGDYMEKLQAYMDSVSDYEMKLEMSVPDAPFHKWWEFLSKRMLHYAAYHGYDGIRIVGGKRQCERYSLIESKGLEKLYDNIIIGYFKKYLKKWKIRPVSTDGYWDIHISEELKHDVINLLQPLFRMGTGPGHGCYIADEVALYKMKKAGIESLTTCQVQDTRVLGFYDGAYDKIYVVPENHTDWSDLSNTVVHEMVGHRGLKELMGSRYAAFLNAIYHDAMDVDKRKEYIGKYGNKYVAAEEFCADMLENMPEESSIVARIIGTIRIWLFRAGWNITLTNRELYCLLRQSQNINKMRVGLERKCSLKL